MTEEQHTQWRVLSLRERAAQLAGDQDTVQAIQAEKRAVLGLPDPQRARQQRDIARTAEAEQRRLRLHAEGQARPRGRLTASQLTTAVGDVEQRQTRERVAAELTWREVAERGPLVARLDAEQDRLHQRAEVQRRVEDIQRRWQTVTRRADEAERGVRRSIEADRIPAAR